MSVVRDKSRRAASTTISTTGLGGGGASGGDLSILPPLCVSGAAHLAAEMLVCIESLHAAGFVHRGECSTTHMLFTYTVMLRPLKVLTLC